MKAIVDVEKCIACGMCSAVCASIFYEDDNGYAHAKDVSLNEGELLQTNLLINQCPVKAISLKKVS